MRRLSLLLLTLLAAGCHELNPRLLPLPPDGADLPILRQYFRVHGSEDRPMRLTVRDAATWSQAPLLDIPVRFDEEMLIVVTLGRRLSDQYRVQINRIWREGGLLKVDYEVTAPPRGAPLVVSSPYCIAVVPRCDLNVEGFPSAIPATARRRVPDILREPREQLSQPKR